MIPEEIFNYCKKNGIDIESVGFFNGGIIIRDPKYNKLLIPRFALLYNYRNNAIALIKIDGKTGKIIDDKARMFENENVKDIQTFLTYVKSINSYCRKYNCDYSIVTLLGYNTISGTKKNIFIESSTNHNQRIIHIKNKKEIIFSENRGSEIAGFSLPLDETLSDFIDEEDNFTKFAKESFEFCKKNECSLEYYAKEISPEMLGFKYSLSKYAEKHQQEKLLYTFFDKDSKTGFAYYGDNTINAFKIIDNGLFCFKMRNRPSSLLKSNERFEAHIKTNKASIDEEVDKRVKEYIEQKELKRFTNANNEFAGRGPRMA